MIEVIFNLNFKVKWLLHYWGEGGREGLTIPLSANKCNHRVRHENWVFLLSIDNEHRISLIEGKGGERRLNIEDKDLSKRIDSNSK